MTVIRRMATRPVAPWIDALPHCHAPQKMVLDWITRNVPVDKKAILDVGIGNSYLSTGLAMAGAVVFQADHDPKCLETQRAHFKNARFGVPTQYQIDIGKAPLPDSHWPLIITTFTHEHLKPDEESRFFLGEIARALSPDGTYVLTDRVSDRGETYWWGERGDPMWVRTPADLRKRVLECGLTITDSASFSYDFNTNAKLEPAEWKPDDKGIVLILKGNRADAGYAARP